MIEKNITLCPNAEIYIMTLPPSNLFLNTSKDGKYIAISQKEDYNEIIVKYANEYNLPLINMDNVFDGDDCSNYLVDFAHLNLTGMD